MNEHSKPINCIITGVGGQGNVLAARLLASVALDQDYEVTVGDVYGLTQRGGAVASHVRWTMGDALPPLVPEGFLDILVAFEPMESLRIMTQYGNKDTRVIVNQTPVVPIGVQTGRFVYPKISGIWDAVTASAKELRIIDATAIAQDIGSIQFLNMVMMGFLFGTGFIELKSERFESQIRNSLSERYFSANLRAFEQGMNTALRGN
jgi:indolepyruvate ferredoxin oxidoreductase beta subunit